MCKRIFHNFQNLLNSFLYLVGCNGSISNIPLYQISIPFSTENINRPVIFPRPQNHWTAMFMLHWSTDIIAPLLCCQHWTKTIPIDYKLIITIFFKTFCFWCSALKQHHQTHKHHYIHTQGKNLAKGSFFRVSAKLLCSLTQAHYARAWVSEVVNCETPVPATWNVYFISALAISKCIICARSRNLNLMPGEVWWVQLYSFVISLK